MFGFSKFESLTRQTLIELLKTYAGNAITIDGLWFSILEEKIGLKETIKIDEEVWKRYAAIEAKRIKKVLNITGKDIQALFTVLNFQIWCSAPGFKYEILESDEEKIVFNVLECRSQRARLLSGKSQHPCKSVNWAVFEEIAKEVNPDLKLKCIFCPPDKHPDDLWCSWEFRLEKDEQL